MTGARTPLGFLSLIAMTIVLIAGCAGSRGRSGSPNWREQGLASWYGADFHGRRTANGERYNMYAMTAAHKTLPFGTQIVVIDQRTGRRIRVRVNDRGPFVAGRIVDLSLAAARALGSAAAGVVPVTLEAFLPESAFATAAAVMELDPANPLDPPLAKGERGGLAPREPKTRSPGRGLSPGDGWSTEMKPGGAHEKSLPPLRGSFAVQFGAFAVESNARVLAARLPAPRGASGVLPFEDNRGTWWRVRVGGYESELEASAAAAAFAELGHPGFVVRED